MNNRQFKKFINELASMPYVPDKPTHKPELSDYCLSQDILKKNEENKKKKIKAKRLITVSIPIIALLLIIFDPWVTIDQHNMQINSIIGNIGIILFGISFWVVPCTLLSPPPETEIDIQFKQYQRDKQNWIWWTELYPKKKVKTYWQQLDGYSFEKELASVFLANHYKVTVTSKSNDGGVDIILNKNNQTTYVQCKAHKSKIGVAVVRELYGVMQSDNIKSGMVASLNGFTSGAIEFANEKNIMLISVEDIISMIN